MYCTAEFMHSPKRDVLKIVFQRGHGIVDKKVRKKKKNPNIAK